ncbi:DUF58 domain-containing protein [Candidatus Pacearchaeota archaeon]|nr:DUF58 domain-containing protein [Candidatus Pacearchaeota archaeon]
MGKLNLDIPSRVAELQASVRELELHTKLYHTILRGKGLEFDSYRIYSPGDDAAIIDWKASTRTNKLLVKQYKEEKNIGVMFVIDVGEHMIFGSTEKLKCEYSAELASALGNLILNSDDRLGLILFNDKVSHVLSPAKGMSQLDLFVDAVSNPSVYGGGCDMGKILSYLVDSVDTSVSAVFIISDFIRLKERDVNLLKFVGSKFETVAMMVKDPRDKELPPISGEFVIEDPQSGYQMLIDPSEAKNAYHHYAAEQEKFVKDSFQKADIDVLELSTASSFVPPLAEFLNARARDKRSPVFL